MDTHLNDDCIRMVLSWMPHQQLFSVRLVCRRFDVLARVVLRTSKSLKLFGTKTDLVRFRELLFDDNLLSDDFFASGIVIFFWINITLNYCKLTVQIPIHEQNLITC